MGKGLTARDGQREIPSLPYANALDAGLSAAPPAFSGVSPWPDPENLAWKAGGPAINVPSRLRYEQPVARARGEP
jgi:hypothetical protein